MVWWNSFWAEFTSQQQQQQQHLLSNQCYRLPSILLWILYSELTNCTTNKTCHNMFCLKVSGCVHSFAWIIIIILNLILFKPSWILGTERSHTVLNLLSTEGVEWHFVFSQNFTQRQNVVWRYNVMVEKPISLISNFTHSCHTFSYKHCSFSV